MSAPSTMYVTQCELCKQQQKNPPRNMGTLATPGADLQAYMAKLYMHIGTKHAREFQIGKEMIACFQQFLALSQVKSEDPAVNRYYDELRDSILALFGITVTQPR